MPNVTSATDGIPAGPPCPVCSGPAVDTVVMLKGAQATANHLCGREHIWITTWLIDPPTPAAADAS